MSQDNTQQSCTFNTNGILVQVTGRGATVVTNESNMGEGQVPKRVKRLIPSRAFPAASKNIHCFGRAPAGVGIVDRKEGCVD